MKTIKQLIISGLIILAPMIYGVSVYSELPTKMATHFGIDNTPNGFMSRSFFIFGLPLLMLLVQILCTYTMVYAAKNKPASRFQEVVAWVIPVFTVILYPATILYNLGNEIDFWRLTVTIVSLVFIITGNYLPTFNGERKQDKRWRGAQFPAGRVLFYGGILLLISIFFNPILSVVLIAAIIIGIFAVMLIAKPHK